VTEPVWLPLQLVVSFHDEQLREFGGPPGIRDHGMLESALGRPQNNWAYGETGLAALAAAYAYGIVRNHPFVDGNKRAGLLAIVVFLGLNSVAFEADNAEFVVMIQGLAAGEIEEEGLTRWIRDNWPKPPGTTEPTKEKGTTVSKSGRAGRRKT
jgi:death on curing protein